MIFTFDSALVAKLLRHSLAASEHNLTYAEKLDGKEKAKAGLHLVADMGVYLMSNGEPNLPLDPEQDVNEKYYRRLVAYSKEIDDKTPAGGLHIRRKRLGTGDDFVVPIPADWFKLRELDRSKSVRLQVTKRGEVAFHGYKALNSEHMVRSRPAKRGTAEELYNSRPQIRKWMRNVLETSKITPEQRAAFEQLGERMIEAGEWRGDISEAFLKMDGGELLQDLFL